MTSGQYFTIREAKLEDCDKIFQMKMVLVEHHKMEHLMLLTVADLKRDGFGEDPKIKIIVVEEAEEASSSSSSRRLVGYCMYHFFYDFVSGPAMRLADMYVESPARGRGIGTALMKYLAKVALRNNYRTIQWFRVADNASAETFFKKFGAVDMTERSKYHLLKVSTKEMKQMTNSPSEDDGKLIQTKSKI